MNPTKSKPLVLSCLSGHVQVLIQKFILSIELFLKNEILNHAAAAAFFFKSTSIRQLQGLFSTTILLLNHACVRIALKFHYFLYLIISL